MIRAVRGLNDDNSGLNDVNDSPNDINDMRILMTSIYFHTEYNDFNDLIKKR